MELLAVRVEETKQAEGNMRLRSDFEGPAFDELVASIKEHGVLAPILVRKLTGAGRIGKWEVIAGNRRLAAARAAGLETVPAQLATMSDTEAKEAQIVENVQRADVHPLEEGTAYRQLIEGSRPRYTPADVALKVGKGEAYVRDRLVLTNLTKEAQRRYRAGLFGIGHAALLARTSHKEQTDLLAYLENWHSGEPTDKTVAELRAEIQRHAAADIAAAPWKDDEQLAAVYAGCDECRGKGADLFGQNAASACSNPVCYVQRAAAYVQLKRKETPALLLLANEYGKPEPYGPEKERVHSKSEYTEVGIRGSKKCASALRGIVVAGEGIGHTKLVCIDKECSVHKGDYRSSYDQTPEEKAKAREARKAELAQEREKHAAEEAELAEALAALAWPMSEAALDALLGAACYRAGHGGCMEVAKRHKMPVVQSRAAARSDYEQSVLSAAAKLTASDKLQLLAEVITAQRYHSERVKVIRAAAGGITKKTARKAGKKKTV